MTWTAEQIRKEIEKEEARYKLLCSELERSLSQRRLYSLRVELGVTAIRERWAAEAVAAAE